MNGKYQGFLEQRWNDRNDERINHIQEKREKRMKAAACDYDDESEADDAENHA